MVDIRSLPTIAARQRALMRWYRTHGRHALPWRYPALREGRGLTRDPYAILVSEVMLQQTQVPRVLAYWTAWMRRWPTVESLARARRASVIRAWAGLGYNRRAVYLHRAAKEIARNGWPIDVGAVLRPRPSEWAPMEGRPDTTISDLARSLQRLPGIGSYTSHALLAFTANLPAPCVDTNVRRVLAHVIYRRPIIMKLPLREIERLAARVIPKGKARDWTYALMDYGALVLHARDIPNRLKRSTVPFKNSHRFWRGRIVAALRATRAPLTREQVITTLALHGDPPDTLDDLLAALAADGVIRKRANGFALA